MGLNATELRVLQLLANNGGQQTLQQLQPQMSRIPLPLRKAALANLQGLELMTETPLPAKRPGARGGGLLYRLTPEGAGHVEELRQAGVLARAKRGAA
jgi:hypothetical protein